MRLSIRQYPANSRTQFHAPPRDSNSLLHSESGASLIELAVLLPILLLMLAGAIDLGQAYYAAIEVNAAAQAGTNYGLTNSSDTVGMAHAAQLDAADINGMSASATWGCECQDGTGAVASCGTTPTCSSNVVDYVDVQTSASLSSIMTFGAVPSSFTLKGHSRIRLSP